MSQTCLDCARRSDRMFCDLPNDALQEFEEIRSLQTFPRGSVLFREGQPARAVFVLCDGRARLSVCSDDGRRLTVRVVPAGEVLGLSAALAGGRYEVTAEVMDTVQVAEVRRNKLLHFLRGHRDVCMQVVNTLSEDLHLAYARVRTVGLGRTRQHHPHAPAPQLHQ